MCSVIIALLIFINNQYEYICIFLPLYAKQHIFLSVKATDTIFLVNKFEVIKVCSVYSFYVA